VSPDQGIRLEVGSQGEAVIDVQRRLEGLGFTKGIDPEGSYRDGTRAAIEAFQYRRGLRVDGVCGIQTWSALVEAGRRLGDRFLYRRSPMLRGDDVAELQQRLSALGFDTGRVDGIFGDRTEAALRDLQRGLGLDGDGLCGPATLRSMGALARAVGGGDPWALRQQAEVSGAGSSLAGKVVVLDPGHGGEDPGAVAYGLTEADVVLDVAARVEGRLAASGVTPVLTRGAGTGPDDVTRAALADDVGADVVLSLHCAAHESPRAGGVASFFWGDVRVGARSAVGEQLALLVQSEVIARTGLLDLRSHACTLDMVRITRMPAVQVEIGYLTNPDDARLLGDPGFRDAVAESLVIAIQRLYLGDHDFATGTLQLHDVMSFAGRA